MLTGDVLANVYVKEDTATAEELIEFPWVARRVIVINDGATNLTFSLKNTASSGITLKPSETITFEMRTGAVKVQGNSVPYRLWAFG